MAQNQTLTKPETTSAIVPENTRSGLFFTPRVDIYETSEEVMLLCDLPGVRPSDIEVSFERGELTLQGKVAPRPAALLLEEYSVGDFFRTFAINPEIDAQKIAAEYRDGVLTVHLPKQESSKPRRIAVKSA